MKKKYIGYLIFTGTMLLLAALFLALYNINESRKSGKNAQEILIELKSEIAENVEPENNVTSPTNDLYDDYENLIEVYDEPIMEIDGIEYIGYISIPKLEIELPVAKDWDYDKLKDSPCRYFGSVASNNIIVAAHNYSTHFGNISSLNTGDLILFTNAEGKLSYYEIIQTDTIGGYDIESMKDGAGIEWDLTLFTCTIGGQSRVSVRAVEWLK